MIPTLIEVFGLVEDVQVYRGMTSVKRDALGKLIGDEPSDEGVESPDVTLDSGKNPWWATKLGIAMAYSSTPNVRKNDGEYDVVVVGALPDSAREHILGNQGIVDFKKTGARLPIKITKVAYTRTGPGSEQKLRRLLGQ